MYHQDDSEGRPCAIAPRAIHHLPSQRNVGLLTVKRLLNAKGRGSGERCQGLWERDKEFFIDHLLVRIHLVIEMI